MSTDDKKVKRTTSKVTRAGANAVPQKAANAGLTTNAQLHMTDSVIGKASDERTAESVRFGPAIKAFRAKAGLSQAELADIVHVSRNTVVKWENDGYKPDHDTIVELCKILGMSLDDLYGIATTAVTQQELKLNAPYRSERDALYLLHKVEESFEPVRRPIKGLAKGTDHRPGL